MLIGGLALAGVPFLAETLIKYEETHQFTYLVELLFFGLLFFGKLFFGKLFVFVAIDLVLSVFAIGAGTVIAAGIATLNAAFDAACRTFVRLLCRLGAFRTERLLDFSLCLLRRLLRWKLL